MSDLPAGAELDRLVAERVMGWRWHQPPKYDYHGPLPEQGAVLVPPGFDEKGFEWPPKGVIPVGFFCSAFNPSTNIAHAWEVVEKMNAAGLWQLLSQDWAFNWCCGFAKAGEFGPSGGWCDTAPLAICRAALKMVQP